MNWLLRKILGYLYGKVYPCSPCEWACCKAQVCHASIETDDEENHYEKDCYKKPWYRALRFFLWLEDKYYLIDYHISRIFNKERP